MIDKKLTPALTIAAFMIGLGIAAMVMGAVTGSDAILFAGPFWFLLAAVMAYRVRLEREAESKPSQSNVIDPSRFRP